jgi:hypothetical protein
MFKAARLLCPKLSRQMSQKLKEKKAESAKMKLALYMRAFVRVAEAISTSTEMGIKLLAYHLRESRELFLWWD